MGPESLAIKGVPALARLAQYLANRNTAEFLKARDEMFRDWVVELHRALEAVHAFLDSRIDGLEARLEEVVRDPQFSRILDNYAIEAAREAIDERRWMLAHAAAGTITPNLSTAQKARIERIIRELDPEDVLLLHRIAGINDVDDSPNARITSNHDEMRRSRLLEERLRVLGDSVSRDALVASGCVRTWTESALDADWGAAEVTPTGEMVLTILQTYIIARSQPQKPATDAAEHFP